MLKKVYKCFNVKFCISIDYNFNKRKKFANFVLTRKVIL